MSSRVGRGLLATYLRPESPRAILLGLALISGLAFQLANPLIAKSFIDAASVGKPIGSLLHLAVAFIAVALAAQISMVAETYCGNDLGWRTTNALRRDLVDKVLRLDGSFHSRHNAGELVERLDGDVSAIAGFFSRFVVYVVGNGLFLIGVVAVVFSFDWRIGVVLGAFAALALAVMIRAGRFVGRRSRASREAIGRLSGFIEERLGGLVDLKANGGDAHVMAALDDAMGERRVTSRASALAGSSYTASISVVFAIGTGASLAVSAWLYRRGAVSVGTVFAVFRYTTMLRFPLEQLARQMNSLQQATGGLVRVGELLATTTLVKDGPDALTSRGPASLEFDHVRFGYGARAVLEDVTFQLAPGEVLGVIGRTGAGKTTVARLAFRLYDPDSGTVRLDGRDISRARLDDLRGRIGLVTQEVQLFEASLRDNMTLFDDAVADTDLLAVLEHLGLDPWLARMPSGLDTALGTSGVGLSAGEAQLVALARVFLADPGLVILDEASSRLDPATEALLESAIDRLLEERSGIVIAHRLSTLDRVDAILVLEDGRVVEKGRRVELAADPSSRYSLLSRLGFGEVLA